MCANHTIFIRMQFIYLYVCVCVCVCVCVYTHIYIYVPFWVIFRAQLKKWNYLIMTVYTFLILLISLPNLYSKWLTINFVLLFSKVLFILN